MVFSNIFKKGNRKKEGQDDSSDKEVQKKMPLKGSGDKSEPETSAKTVKKAKAFKNNKAPEGSRKKKRSNRTSHIKKSFHPKRRRPAKEQINIHDIIERPVITEKAANESEKGVYTFLVREKADKHRIAEAIEELYGVKPKKVCIARRPSRKKRVRIPGKEREYGMTAAKKKAYVFLHEGDKIKLT